MGAQRADISEGDRLEGEAAIARIRKIQQQIRDRNPDMTQDDWDQLADAWAEEVNEGLRRHVRRLRGELDAQTP